MAIVGRVQGMLLRPRQEWQIIDTEQTTTGDLYRGYVAPLAAIGSVPTAVGRLLFGTNVALGTVIAEALVSFALSLAFVYVAAILIDRLAPRFGGTPNMAQALKVSAYGWTAAFVAGIFAIVPALGVLGILGLYSLYQIHTGLPVLMKAPPERAFGYTAAVVGVVFVITVVLSAAWFVVFPPA